MKNYIFLNKVVSHALRHEPWMYELELDDEDWVSVEDILAVLRADKSAWINLCEDDLVAMIIKNVSRTS